MKESAEIWNDAARSLEFQDSPQAAAACYEKAREFGDESTGTLLNLAISYMELYEFYKQDKFLALAKGYLIAGIRKDERNSRLHHYLGLVYLALGEKELAVQEFVSTGEKMAEEGSELAWRFDLPLEEPEVYVQEKTDPYELFPDPALYRIFDLVKGFPLDNALMDSLKETYGNKDAESLLALYLRSIYFKVFEDREFSAQLGLSSNQSKWESLLVFFVRGLNSESKSLVKASLSEGRLELPLLPVYTRMLVGRYRREIIASTYDRESFKALIVLPLRKLEALDEACELSRVAKETGNFSKSLGGIMDALAKVGLARKSGKALEPSDQLLAGFGDAGRIKSKLSMGQHDSELSVLLYGLLRAKRMEYALGLAKKIRALYDENEATAYIKDVLSSLSLSEDEIFEIISES